MPTVEPFSRGMIETWVKTLAIPYLTTTDGDIVLEFPAHDERTCDVTFVFTAELEPSAVYSVRISSDKAIPRRQLGQATLVCNTWNKIHRFPKAYLDVDDDSAGVGWIRLEYDLPLNNGVHQELLDDLGRTMLGGAFAFWEWAVGEQHL